MTSINRTASGSDRILDSSELAPGSENEQTRNRCRSQFSIECPLRKQTNMKGNIPIPELPHGEDVWLMVVVTSVRDRRSQQGKRFCDALARNATGSITAENLVRSTRCRAKRFKPGLWGLTGRLENFQDRPQFVVAEYRPITHRAISRNIRDESGAASGLHAGY